MASSFTRTHGANARSLDWGEPDSAPQRRGNWLPLDALEAEDLYQGTPQLQAVPAPRRSAPVGRPDPERLQPTRPQPKRQERNAANARPSQGISSRALAMIAGGMLSALAIFAIVSAAVEWVQIKLDDLQYGRPRTVQLDAYVGHSEANGLPTHFIAMNLNRRVTILEMPGSDISKVNTIVGPYLFGQGEDLTPVQLNVQDVNADAKPDLVVTVKSEQLIYLNDGASFRLITPEERAALQGATSKPVNEPGATQEVGK